MSSPQILTVDLGERSYDIQVGHGLLDQNPAFQALARGRSVAVISDSNVDPIYGAKVEALLAPVAHRWCASWCRPARPASAGSSSTPSMTACWKPGWTARA